MKRLKRSDCLVFHYQHGRLCGRNYLTGVEIEISASVMRILERMTGWHSREHLVRSLAPFPAILVKSALRALQACSFVVTEGSRQAGKERAMRPWNDWGLEARFYHFSTKRAHTVPPASDEAKLIRYLLRRGSMPARVKRYPGRTILPLPAVEHRLTGDFPDIVLRRRTVRRFGSGPVKLEEVAILLRMTWGFTSSLAWPGLGKVPVRTSPSGGARYPIDVYVAPAKVVGLKPRLHYYRPDRHQLIELDGRVDSEQLRRFCGYQDWAKDASALFIMTAVLPRMTWRYRSSRAYRVVLLEAGHLCQTFCLAATWLRLAPFCTAALDDDHVERIIGIDGGRETVVYAAGVGPLTNDVKRDPAREAPMDSAARANARPPSPSAAPRRPI